MSFSNFFILSIYTLQRSTDEISPVLSFNDNSYALKDETSIIEI